VIHSIQFLTEFVILAEFIQYNITKLCTASCCNSSVITERETSLHNENSMMNMFTNVHRCPRIVTGILKNKVSLF
jgi:hypothetical protein